MNCDQEFEAQVQESFASIMQNQNYDDLKENLKELKQEPEK